MIGSLFPMASFHHFYFGSSNWCSLVYTEFDKLLRMIQRQHNVSEPIPPFFIKTLLNLETSLNSAIAKEKEAKKKMNATNAKALTAMKQKVKKAQKEYESDLTKYQAVSAFWELVFPYSLQSSYRRTLRRLKKIMPALLRKSLLLPPLLPGSSKGMSRRMMKTS
jgi:hypothetical protein